MADVADAHTSVSFAGKTLFPLSLQSFEEGIFVIAAIPGYEEFIGSRLLEVRDTSVDEYGDMAGEITPHDDPSQLAMWTPVHLALPSVLAGLGVVDAQAHITSTLVVRTSRRQKALPTPQWSAGPTPSLSLSETG